MAEQTFSPGDTEPLKSKSAAERPLKTENIFTNAMVETGFREIKNRAPWPAQEGEKGLGTEKSTFRPEAVRFQGMLVAYFALDSDSEGDKVVLNQIVGLKEDAGKN